mmetsp:Transcript_29358/g.41874  ORF Transcript_29358/g.41874 Transcript_29358/m.41874 type:complete len:290 (+) Transcript_29358:47-916(+)
MASNNCSMNSVENCSDTIVSVREGGKLNEINSHECQNLIFNSSHHMGYENESPKNHSDFSEVSIKNSSKRSNESQEKRVGKRPRTNYKDPENSAKLNAALSMLINQDGEGQIIKDIKSVAKIFGVPYNTLRDNFLRLNFISIPITFSYNIFVTYHKNHSRATTGQVNKLKKDVKQKIPKNAMTSISKEMVYVPLAQYPLSFQHLQSACNPFPSKPIQHLQGLQIQCNQQLAPTYFLCKAPDNMDGTFLQFHPHTGLFIPRHQSSSSVPNIHPALLTGENSVRHSYHGGN